MLNVRRTGGENAEFVRGLQELGDQLNKLRLSRGLSLAHVSMRVGCNSYYLSDLERGRLVPNDNLTRALARFYGLDENELFERLGKVPLAVREELESSPLLQKILKEITSAALSPEKKEALYEQFYGLLKDFEIQGQQ